MRNLEYHGPGDRLRLPSGRTVDRGQTAEVTNDDAAAAEASSRQHVTITDLQDDTPAATGEGHDTDTSQEA